MPPELILIKVVTCPFVLAARSVTPSPKVGPRPAPRPGASSPEAAARPCAGPGGSPGPAGAVPGCLVISAPVHDHGDFPSARRRVSAARKAVRVIARKTLRHAETLRAPAGNSPPRARQPSGTRQPSATRPATGSRPYNVMVTTLAAPACQRLPGRGMGAGPACGHVIWPGQLVHVGWNRSGCRAGPGRIAGLPLFVA